MINFATTDLDSMMKDIVDIFNLEGVKLVRLSGLFLREREISNYKDLTPDELDKIVHKLKKANVINYQYITYCPHCNEVSYQVEKQENPFKAKRCDTCGQIFIPQNEISLYELKQ
jgi:hypothetical protein